MIPTKTYLARVGEGLVLAARLGHFIITFVWTWVQPRAILSAKVLALQSQLAARKDCFDRKKPPSVDSTRACYPRPPLACSRRGGWGSATVACAWKFRFVADFRIASDRLRPAA